MLNVLENSLHIISKLSFGKTKLYFGTNFFACFLLLIGCICPCRSQTISPEVLNSAGRNYSVIANNIYITDNVGEPFVTTLLPVDNIMISQGFLQANITTGRGLTLSWIKNDVSCEDKKDGNISLSISGALPSDSVTYFWTPSTVCPNNSCSLVDSLVSGNYSVMVVVNHSASAGINSDTLRSERIEINDLNGPCRIKIYTAVTPNGDNNNDTWQIDNITDFPNNHVVIYSRWGQKVFETDGYDNISQNRSWPAKDEINKLMPSTYFYVLNLGDGSNSLKGWVELIKN
jgi:gliding motility-associated-like protein